MVKGLVGVLIVSLEVEALWLFLRNQMRIITTRGVQFKIAWLIQSLQILATLLVWDYYLVGFRIQPTFA